MAEENNEPAFPSQYLDRNNNLVVNTGITKHEYAKIHAPNEIPQWFRDDNIHKGYSEALLYFEWKKYFAKHIMEE